MRTHLKYCRAYVSGYDVSGNSRSFGTLGYGFDNTPDASLTDDCKNIVNGQMTIQVDPLNAFLAPETSPAIGSHELLKSGAGTHTYTIAYGALAVPAQGDFIFSTPTEQASYKSEGVAVNIGWGGPTSTNTLQALGFGCPFGRLLHAKSAVTAVNSAIGIDDYGATPPSLGGIFVYHLFSSDVSVTLTVEDSDTNSDAAFTASGAIATSGSITAAVTPKHGMVATSATLAVKRYLRWQIAFGSAGTATFLCGFHRRLWL
jgi:hypothetical protein